MIRWLVELSLKFHLLIIALAGAIIILGIIQLFDMPLDSLPEFAPPYIEVQTEVPGLSDAEVEELVTYNLEELLNGTPWLQSIRSISVPGLSSITLTFEPQTDISRARQLVSERLSLAYALPNVAQAPIILQPLSAMSRVILVGLTAKQISPIEMSVLAYWNIRPALLSVPGVANVAIWGMRNKQLQVQVDPNKLQVNNIKLDQIISTTGNALWVSPLSFLNASTPGSGGWIDTPQQRIEVRHVLPILSPQDLAKIVIEHSTRSLLEITKVVEGHPPLIGDAIVNNGPGLLIVIEKFPGANILEVTRDVLNKLAELKPGLSGIQIDTTLFRPASFVNLIIKNTAIALSIGLFLFILVLFPFVYTWRALLISITAIFVSLALALIILNLIHVTMNMMLLAALIIALVIITDDAIINVENIVWNIIKFQRQETTKSFASLILDAYKIQSALIYATLILILTLIPIYFLNGVSKVFFPPLIISFGIVLLTSLITSLTVTPALCFLLLPRSLKADRREFFLLDWFKRGYKSTFDWMMDVLSPLVFTLGIIFLSIITIMGITLINSIKNSDLVPPFREPNIVIQWEGPPGASSEEMVRITTRASRQLSSLKGVKNVSAILGRAVLGDQVVDVNSAKLIVNVDTGVGYQHTIANIQKVVDSYPGIFHVVQTYLKERMRQVFTGSSSDIVVHVFGPQFSILRNKALEIKQILTQIKGTKDIYIEPQIEQPQITIEVDLAKAKNFGLKPGDVRRGAATLIAGIEAGSLFEEQKIFPVVVWGTEATRDSLNSIRELLIDTPSGKWVHLADVANVTITPIPNMIKHEMISRGINVNVNVQGRHPSAVLNDIRAHLQNMQFPLEYRAQVRGAYQDEQTTKNRLIILGTAVAVAIFLLLQAAFGSFRLAFIIFITLPLALIGGVIDAFIIKDFSLASLFGLIIVLGITIRHVLLLINHYQYLEREENGLSGSLLIRRGVQEQFRVIVITTICAGLLLFPFAILGSFSGLEIVSSMAKIILGGLITSALFTLLIVPPLYLWFGGSSKESLFD